MFVTSLTTAAAAALLLTPRVRAADLGDGGGGGGGDGDGACGWSAAAAFCNEDPGTHFEHGIGYPKGGTAGPSLPTTSEKECCCACAQQGPRQGGGSGWRGQREEAKCRQSLHPVRGPP